MIEGAQELGNDKKDGQLNQNLWRYSVNRGTNPPSKHPDTKVLAED